MKIPFNNQWMGFKKCLRFSKTNVHASRFYSSSSSSSSSLVAERSKAWVCSRSPAGVAVSNPLGAWMFVCCECCVFVR